MKTNDDVTSQKIVKYLKKSLGKTQLEIADLVGCNRVRISRIESGKLSFTLKEMYHLSRLFSFSLDLLASSGKIEIAAPQDSRQFLMPAHWQVEQFSSGKITEAYIDYFVQCFGQDYFEQFCLNQKIDSLYFFNRGNPINLNFLQKLIQHMIVKKQLGSQEAIYTFAQFIYQQKTILSTLGIEEKMSPLTRLATSLKSASRLERNHKYEIRDINEKKGELTFSFKPEDHVHLPLWKDDAHLGGYLEKWISTIFPLYTGLEDYQVEALESMARNDHLCTYKVSGFRGDRHDFPS